VEFRDSKKVDAVLEHKKWSFFVETATVTLYNAGTSGNERTSQQKLSTSTISVIIKSSYHGKERRKEEGKGN
jgi:hypothetical protein